jgi:hypothetical protein
VDGTAGQGKRRKLSGRRPGSAGQRTAQRAHLYQRQIPRADAWHSRCELRQLALRWKRQGCHIYIYAAGSGDGRNLFLGVVSIKRTFWPGFWLAGRFLNIKIRVRNIERALFNINLAQINIEPAGINIDLAENNIERRQMSIKLERRNTKLRQMSIKSRRRSIETRQMSIEMERRNTKMRRRSIKMRHRNTELRHPSIRMREISIKIRRRSIKQGPASILATPRFLRFIGFFSGWLQVLTNGGNKTSKKVRFC